MLIYLYLYLIKNLYICKNLYIELKNNGKKTNKI